MKTLADLRKEKKFLSFEQEQSLVLILTNKCSLDTYRKIRDIIRNKFYSLEAPWERFEVYTDYVVYTEYVPYKGEENRSIKLSKIRANIIKQSRSL
jgi:hypothetical protein